MFLAIQFFHPKIAKLIPIVDSFQREGHTFSPDGGKKEIVLPKGHISWACHREWLCFTIHQLNQLCSVHISRALHREWLVQLSINQINSVLFTISWHVAGSYFGQLSINQINSVKFLVCENMLKTTVAKELRALWRLLSKIDRYRIMVISSANLNGIIQDFWLILAAFT